MVTFNFTYDPGITVQQALGFEMAGRIWSNFLSDAATLHIHIGMSSNLPTNVIGGALPGIAPNFTYSQIRERLQADSTSNDDRASVSSLGPLDTMQHTFSVNGVQDRVSHFLTGMNLTRAGGKALGLVSTTSTALDGAIVMGNLANSRFHWNYDFTRINAAPSGSLDFLSVALHEIGHILGFVSGVDKTGTQNSVITTTSDPTFASRFYVSSTDGRVNYATPLDLFRVDAQLRKDMTYGSGQGTRGFVPGGTAVVAQFSTGRNTSILGDGFQASHWKEQATPIGIMDPAVAPQERVSISNIDLRAFDTIGWNLRNGLNATTFTTTFLNNLRTQAVSSLARRLGQTTTWINSNLTVVPTNLGRDRTTDVETMIRNSLIYEWGTTGSGATSIRGRRWMEIFNQMASNQEVYVNFSTVSQVAPPPAMMTSAELEQGSSQSGSDRPLAPGDASAEPYTRAWGSNGSGSHGNKHRPRRWSIPTGQNPGSDKDPLSGVENVKPLVGDGVFDGFNPGTTPSVGFPVTTSAATMATWAPVVTWMAEGAAASVLPLTTGSGSRQQPANILVSGPNTLLGHENNPLVQNSLAVGLMGAIA